MTSIYANINSEGVDLKSVIGGIDYSIGDIVGGTECTSPASFYGGTGKYLPDVTNIILSSYSGLVKTGVSSFHSIYSQSTRSAYAGVQITNGSQNVTYYKLDSQTLQGTQQSGYVYMYSYYCGSLPYSAGGNYSYSVLQGADLTSGANANGGYLDYMSGGLSTVFLMRYSGSVFFGNTKGTMYVSYSNNRTVSNGYVYASLYFKIMAGSTSFYSASSVRISMYQRIS